MPRRASVRAEALRLAHQAKSARDTARQHREAQVEAALADYYQATAEADRIRDTASRKAAALLADADRAAAPQSNAAAQAVRRLRSLLGGITETAQLCGLTTVAVRDILAGRTLVGNGDSAPQEPARPAPVSTKAAGDIPPDASHLPSDEGDHEPVNSGV